MIPSKLPLEVKLPEKQLLTEKHIHEMKQTTSHERSLIAIAATGDTKP